MRSAAVEAFNAADVAQLLALADPALERLLASGAAMDGVNGVPRATPGSAISRVKRDS